MSRLIEQYEGDLVECFDELSEDEQNSLVNWIIENLIPIKSFNLDRTSYGLKHVFENSSKGFYVCNGAFKGAMVKAGFNVRDKNAQNWHFNISKKSPAFKR